MRSGLSRPHGFSALELLVVLGIAGVAAGIAVPMLARTTGDLKLQGDARAIHNMVSLAKMRAATRYTRERFFVDLSSESYFLQYLDRATNTWVTEDGSKTLSTDIDFGFGSIGQPPPNTQSAIQQATLCRNDANEDIPNTACVIFNSRGIPVSPDGTPNGNAGFYLTDYVGVYGITVSATPLVRLWWAPSGTTAWVHK